MVVRPVVAAVYRLAVLCCLSGPLVWCYEDPYVARHPLDALFRSQPSAQKHSGPVPSVGANGSGVAVTHAVSHGSLAGEQHPSHQQSPVPGSFQPLVAPAVGLAQHRGVRRAAEPNRHRWQADQRAPVVFGADTAGTAFARALPAVDIGTRFGSEEEFPGHRGAARPMDTFDQHGAPLDPAENEIGGGPLLLHALGGGGGAGRTPESIDLIREQLERIKQEEDIDIKSNLLMKLLTELPEGPLPIVYIEDAAGQAAAAAAAAAAAGAAEAEATDPDSTGGNGDEDGDGFDENDDDDDDAGRIVTEQFTPNGGKRSGRYYRRYPWKRQNSRSRTYDAEARYLCVPSREDVFKLLVGLHENRIGNHQKTVSFCNRKRPAKAIFTNIRFLG